jgi:hypothetical protein
LSAAALGRDDGGDAFVLEPAKEPAQLGAEDGFVGQAGEERLERVQHDAFGADGIDRVIEPDEQPFEVVSAGVRDFTALDVHVVEHNFFASGQARQVEAERRDVSPQLRVCLLERHEHTRLAEPGRAANEEFRGQQGLAAPRAAAHQRGPPARQPAAGDFIETLDAGGTLGQMSRREEGFVTVRFH